MCLARACPHALTAATPSTNEFPTGRTKSTMTVRPRLRHARRALLVFGAAAALAAGALLGGNAVPSKAATQEPCDIYAGGGTACVAAHSTTRALYAAYNGPLYQVKRASDSTTTSIYPLAAG